MINSLYTPSIVSTTRPTIGFINISADVESLEAVGVASQFSRRNCRIESKESEKSWVRTQRQRSQEGRARENRQWVQVMMVVQRVKEKLQRQMGLAPAHMHILCEKQGKIDEAYKKLQNGWLSNGDKVPPAEFAKVAGIRNPVCDPSPSVAEEHQVTSLESELQDVKFKMILSMAIEDSFPTPSLAHERNSKQERILDILLRLPVRLLLLVSEGLKPFAFRSIDFNLSDAAVDLGCPFETDDMNFTGTIDFQGSCNGLVCLSVEICGRSTTFYIWNPSTRKSKKLPIVEGLKFTTCGFGYDESIDTYKVVAIRGNQELGGVFHSEGQVYTLGTNSWRRSEDYPHSFDGNLIGHFVSGRLHWTAWAGIAYLVVASFDLAKETFGEISLPYSTRNCLIRGGFRRIV
ncbi:hypothetical protein Vadar_007730 [Vaccinium darrowii]|uniref:Uncharacterized protein n=1 Tax=Vaccinium darrowii TaxID=229202 RepID=A0ACB7YC55_9ERIC|nr:hypothetical protein Vadar_007730 [Vaccinium darrowii]